MCQVNALVGRRLALNPSLERVVLRIFQTSSGRLASSGDPRGSRCHEALTGTGGHEFLRSPARWARGGSQKVWPKIKEAFKRGACGKTCSTPTLHATHSIGRHTSASRADSASSDVTDLKGFHMGSDIVVALGHRQTVSCLHGKGRRLAPPPRCHSPEAPEVRDCGPRRGFRLRCRGIHWVAQ